MKNKSKTGPAKPTQSTHARRYHAERQKYREEDEIQARLRAEDEPDEWKDWDDYMEKAANW